MARELPCVSEIVHHGGLIMEARREARRSFAPCMRAECRARGLAYRNTTHPCQTALAVRERVHLRPVLQ